MEKMIEQLSDLEINDVCGGIIPLAAYLTATGLAILGTSIAAFNNGYTVGRDIAGRVHPK
jgi:hypothetical protein